MCYAVKAFKSFDPYFNFSKITGTDFKYQNEFASPNIMFCEICAKFAL